MDVQFTWVFWARVRKKPPRKSTPNVTNDPIFPEENVVRIIHCFDCPKEKCLEPKKTSKEHGKTHNFRYCKTRKFDVLCCFLFED